MNIQINTDNNAHLGEESRSNFTSLITEGLERFSGNITTVEVHLSDDNGSKEGQNDKRCLIEARVEGYHPVVATNHANDFTLAIEGALTTLKHNLAKVKEKLNSH